MEYDKNDIRGTGAYKAASLANALGVELRPRPRYNYGPAPKPPADPMSTVIDGFVKYFGEAMGKLGPAMGVRPVAPPPAAVRKLTTREQGVARARANMKFAHARSEREEKNAIDRAEHERVRAARAAVADIVP